jgi:hypothetical protein
MSGISISPYFPFRRIKITRQAVDAAATKAVIDVVPDQRFQPECHSCGNKAPTVHSWTQRSVRDLNLATTRCGYAASTANCVVPIAKESVLRIWSFFIRTYESPAVGR